MSEPELTLRCTKCDTYKPDNDFTLHASARKARRGRSSWCRECGARFSREYYANNTVACRKAHQDWVNRNKDYISEYGRQRRSEWKKFTDEYKLERQCADCDRISTVPEDLEFDHLPEFKKSFTISNGWQKSPDKQLAELAKCEIVHVSCHRLRTARRLVEKESAS